MEEQKIKVLALLPMELPKEIELDNTLEAMQNFVGGLIECITLDIIRVPGEHTAEHVFPLISLYRIITERTYFKLPQIECSLFLIRCCLSQSKIFSPLIE